MNKYHVYAAGNALVDKEFGVEDQFFIDHGIEKGLMTLVSEEEQQKTIAALEAAVSLKKRAGGGSAANTLYAMSQFGGKSFFTCKVANDETGDFFLQELGELNIETNEASQHVEGVSGQCLIMVTPDAERTMLTYLGVSELMSEAEVNYERVLESEYIYLEGYLVTSPSARDAITKLKAFAEKNGVKTAMTFSDPAMVEYFKDNVNEVLGTGVDLLFCNEREAMLWSDTDSLEAACEAMKSKAKQFAITLGAKGALLFDGEQYIRIAAHAVEAVDSNGAGDSFAGAFLYGITHGHDFETAGKLASLTSATVVSNFGPRLDGEVYRKILEQVV
ncbi:MAG: adenosine kinase [Pseudohongiella sp.]|nr:MAG: adenosine kinase [Pseudohongiella sp.]